MNQPVARRLVLHVAGYDPMSAETAYRRFNRELGRFRKTWGISADAGAFRLEDDVATWTVATRGRDWAVETEIRWLRWDDVMAGLSGQHVAARIARGCLAFADFAASGAFTAYLRHNWRYAVFFVYPVVLLALIALAGAMVGWGVGTIVASAPAGIAAGCVMAAGLLVLARRRARLDHMLDDWIFARRHVRSPDLILRARMDRMAAELIAATMRRDVDEILLVGHSLGAVLAVEIIDHALAMKPDLGTTGPVLSLATVGSSIPKLGFHRAAGPLRDALGRVGEAKAIQWVDYQAYVDVLNFHKLHPVRGLDAGTRGPLVRSVPMRKVLEPDYYRRIRKNLLRVHNQFVSANDLRSSYDYFMLVCGPRTLAGQAALLDGASDCVDTDGSLVREERPPFVPRPGLDRTP